MRRTMQILLPAAIALTLSVGAAVAQQTNESRAGSSRGVAPMTQTRVGSSLAYQFDVRDPALGAQLDVPLDSRFALYPSGAVYFVDQGSLVGFNADVKYRLPAALYLGGGLNVLHRSVAGVGNTDAGVNLLGGIERRSGWLQPFAEGRVILNDGSAFQLAAGLNVALR